MRVRPLVFLVILVWVYGWRPFFLSAPTAVSSRAVPLYMLWRHPQPLPVWFLLIIKPTKIHHSLLKHLQSPRELLSKSPFPRHLKLLSTSNDSCNCNFFFPSTTVCKELELLNRVLMEFTEKLNHFWARDVTIWVSDTWLSSKKCIFLPLVDRRSHQLLLDDVDYTGCFIFLPMGFMLCETVVVMTWFVFSMEGVQDYYFASPFTV